MPFFTKTFHFGARPEFDFRLARSLKIRPLSERKLNSGLATKLNVFVKNAINSFFLDVQYKKKLLVTFPPKTLPLEIIGGTGSLSLAQNVVQSRYTKQEEKRSL